MASKSSATQQSSHHRTPSPPPTPPEASSSRQPRRSSIPQSATSEDSQTVLLNHFSSSESSPKPETQQRQLSPRPDPRTAPSDKEPRKCWICFADETEDSPTSSEWRSPCPCALTAHESCLLDWVADLEAPNNRKTGPSKIECPQCKAKITIARPRSLVVEGVRAVERATGRLTFPFLIVTLAGTVLTGCWMHGYSTVYLIFGPEDADRLLGVNTGAGINSNWGLGLPFIPMTLVAARTSYTDNLLPILPIFYFASTAPQRDGSLWPPSAAMAVATLPYIRAAYNEFWKRVCTPMVKAWIKQVQPRAGENEEGENPEQGHNQGPANELGDGVNIELDFQVDIMGEGEEEEEEEEEDLAGVLGQGRANQDQNQNPNQNPNQQQPGNQDQNQQQNRNPHQHQHVNPGGMPGEANRIVLDTIAIPQTIIGALIFPTISAAMGALLKITLPKTWTTPPTRWDRYPAGFLQSRFGRSIVGGCLFVVLKDTLMLYSRYRLAQDHKQRRVVNFNGKRGKKS